MGCGDTDWGMSSPSSGSTPRAAPQCSSTREGGGQSFVSVSHPRLRARVSDDRRTRIRDRSAIRLAHAPITDDQLLAAIQALNSHPDDALRDQEFTTAIDERAVPATVGFFVEPWGPLGACRLFFLLFVVVDSRSRVGSHTASFTTGPDAHRAPDRLFDALVATNVEHAQMRLPTVRVVRAGTFAEFRRWKGESVNVASGQIKVPLALVHPAAQAWISERVVREL